VSATIGGQSASTAITVGQTAVASVTLTPTTASLTPGQTVQLTATAKDASGNTLTGRSVTWSSTPSSVATVSASGLVTAVGTGSATVSAAIGGKSASSTITIGQTPVASVALTPTTASLTPGQTVQLTATAKDANGNTLTGRTVAWSSAKSAVATVSATGFVTAVAVGTDTITATIGGRSASTSVSVGQPAVASVAVTPTSASIGVGQNTQLTPSAKSASGATVTGVSYAWSTSNSGAATVSTTGLVTGKAAGSATITVSAGGKTASASVAVTGGGSTTPTGYTNLPSGMTTLTEDPYNAVASNGFSTAWGGSTLSIVQDGSAPKSPSSVMQVTYPAGLPGGNAPFQQDHGISGGQYTEFYGAIWVKFSSNFVGQISGVNKLFFIWTDDNGGTPAYYLSAQAVGAENFQPQIRTQDAGAQDLPPNVSGQTGYTFPRNTWVEWEFYIKINTPGSSNGIVRVWMNGVKVSDYTNIHVSPASSQAHLQDYQFAPYWGGTGGSLSAAQFLWIDQSYGAVR
jgi:uncharacterized protein YjdB